MNKQSEVVALYVPSINVYPLVSILIISVSVGAGLDTLWFLLCIVCTIAGIGAYIYAYLWHNRGRLRLINQPLQSNLVYVMVGERYVGNKIQNIAYFCKSGLRLIAQENAKISRTFLLKTRQSMQFSFEESPHGTGVGKRINGDLVIRTQWLTDVVRFIASRSSYQFVDSSGTLNRETVQAVLGRIYFEGIRLSGRFGGAKDGEMAVLRYGFNMRFAVAAE